MQNLPRPLEIHVNIAITFSSTQEMNSVMNALIPDNVNFPSGLSMSIFPSKVGSRKKRLQSGSRSRTVVIKLTSTGQVSTLVNTLDELLEHASVASKVIH